MQFIFIFSSFRIVAESAFWLRHVCLFECLSACFSSASTGRIVVKWILGTLKSVDKVQIWLKLDINIGVTRPGRGVDHTSPSSAEVKERVYLPLLPLWAFVACSRVKFTFTLLHVMELSSLYC